MTTNSLLDLSNPVPVREIQTSGGTLVVRGLGLNVVTDLFQRHTGSLGEIYAKAIVGEGDAAAVDAEMLNAMGELLVGSFPALAADIITHACGSYSEQAAATAQALPFPVQLAVIDAAISLTFTSEVPAGKVVEIVARALRTVLASIPATQQSPA